jgi:NADH:ubiquinone oxidoreductase subunit E
MIYLLGGIILVLIGFSIILMQNIKSLKNENLKLKKIIELKTESIENYKASRVAVKDVLENLSVSQKVMKLLDEGIDKEEIAKRLDIPMSKVELVIKFDKIKKDKTLDE